MSNLRAVWLIARREVVERTRTRAFVVGTLFMVVAAVAVVVIAGLVGGNGRTMYSLGLVGPRAQQLTGSLRGTAAFLNVDLKLQDQAGRDGAESALRRGDVDASLLLQGGDFHLLGKTKVDPGLQQLVNAVVYQANLRSSLHDAGVSPDRADQIARLTPVTIDLQDKPDDDANVRKGAAYVGVLVLYASLLTFGIFIARGVVEEKSNRIVELLLSTVRPAQLLAGKVLGIGILGLGQVLLVVLAAGTAVVAVGTARIPLSVVGAIPQVLLWFVLGYALFCCAYALAGSAASSDQELQSTSMPLTVMLVAVYLGSIAALNEPDAPLVRILSFLPPASPTLMTARALVGHLSWWEEPLAALLTVATTYLLVRFAARMYERGLLRTSKAGWRTLLGAARR